MTTAQTNGSPGLSPGHRAGVLWGAGLILLTLISVTALLQLGGMLNALWRTFPSPGLAWLLGFGAIAILAAAALIVVTRWGMRQGTSSRAILALGLGLIFATRLVAIVVVHPGLVSDWLNYHHQAAAIASGGPWFSSIPTGYPILLAPLYTLFGPHPILGELLNLAMGMWTGVMIFVIVRRRFGVSAAAPALYLFAIFPSQILMTTVLGTEVTYGAFVATAAAAVIIGPRGIRSILLAGLVLGLSQYVRTTSLFLLPAFVLLIWFQRGSVRGAVARSALLIGVVLVVLLPAVGANLAAGAGPLPTTSRYGGWSLLIGLNTETNGQYNLSDQRLIDLPPRTAAWDKRATELALQRLTANPRATLELFVRKFPMFWGADDYGATWTAKPPFNVARPIGNVELLGSQIVYAGTLALATIYLFIRRRERHPEELFMMMLVGCVALLHTFVEIQTRYHSYLIPLLCVLAGAQVAVYTRDRLPGRSRIHLNEPRRTPPLSGDLSAAPAKLPVTHEVQLRPIASLQKPMHCDPSTLRRDQRYSSGVRHG